MLENLLKNDKLTLTSENSDFIFTRKYIFVNTKMKINEIIYSNDLFTFLFVCYLL